jgi:hypothetical protein
VFKTEPSEGQRCKLNHCSNGDVREGDKGMKGIKRRKGVKGEW